MANEDEPPLRWRKQQASMWEQGFGGLDVVKKVSQHSNWEKESCFGPGGLGGPCG